MPKAKSEEPEVDIDLSEVDDMDLGDIDINLDEADLETAIDKLNGEGESLDNESLLLLTKEVRDGFAQLNTLNKDRDATIKKTHTTVVELATAIAELRKEIAELQAAKDKAVVDKVASDRKAGGTKPPTEEKPKASVNGATDAPAPAAISDAVRKKILDVYAGNYRKFSSVQKFAEAINAKTPALAKETIVQVLSEAKLMGRGGTCKPPAGKE